MPAALLKTKLHVPRIRDDIVRRSRLCHALSESAQRPLTLVSAPAGFGKTTLVCEWIRETGANVAWVSLDQGDNDTTRFWSYVVAGIQTVVADAGESTLAALHSPQPAPVEAYLTPLINELTARSQHVILVLDDYHVIDAEEVHRGIEFLLDHMPQHMRLLITCRADPALPLAKLRAKSHLAEIRAADLRFQLDEANALLRNMSGIELTTAEVSAIESRTEGWAVGLHMAGLSLKGRENVAGFVREFSGGHRYVIDYLVDEVLSRQPEQLQQFLLRSSVLDRFSAPLCRALTGDADSQAVLESLERANLFLVPLDDERQWYRYHQLFADVLRTRLQARHPELLTDLHRAASAWFEENCLTSEAISHALLGNDAGRAADLIEGTYETTLWIETQWMTVRNWVRQLPEDLVRQRPRLSLALAWGLFTTGQLEELEPWLDLVEARLRETSEQPEARALLAEVPAIRTWMAYEHGDVPLFLSLAQQALDGLPDASLVRPVVSFGLATGLAMTGDVEGSRAAYAETLSASRSVGNLTVTLMATGGAMQLEVADGNLRRAADLYRQARQLGETRSGSLLGPMGIPCVQMGEVLRERNELQDAETTLQTGIDLVRQPTGMNEFLFEAWVSLARVHWATGDSAGAEEASRQADAVLAEMLGRGGDVLEIVAQALAYRARLWLSQGAIATAARWLEERGVSSDHAAPETGWIDQVLLARVHLANSRADQARLLLEALLETTGVEGCPRAAVEIRAVQALALHALGHQSQAADAVQGALALAEPEGYVRLFADEGEPMRRVLERAARNAPSPYLARLLEACGMASRTSAEATPGQASSGADALTPREVEVLRHIALGLSNDQIAQRLVLAKGTVKKHVNNVYGKLGVRSRTQALARGRELGLIP